MFTELYNLLVDSGFFGGVFGNIGLEFLVTVLCIFIVILPFIFVFAVLWRLLR